MIHTRTKIMAGIAGGLCMLSAGVFGGFQYLLIQHENDLILQEKKVLEAKQQESRLSSMERLIEETASERAELAELILTEEDVVDFLSLIETLGKEQGVIFKTESLKPLEGKTQFDELELDLSVSGDEKQVRNMLRVLESLPYKSSIERVSFSREGGGEKGNNWLGLFTLQVTKYKKI